MFNATISILLFLTILMIGCESMKVVEKDEGYLVLQGNDKILFYQRAPKSLEGKYTRAHYIHPLYGLNGEILTEDFPADHPHHRGIFWAWHQLLVGDQPVGDSWALENFSYDVRDVKIVTTDSNAITIKTEVHWNSPRWTDPKGNMKPFVKEISTIRIHRAMQDFRFIDFEISLLALADEVRIGGSDNAKGYGGFSTRIKLPPDIVFTARKGVVQPQTLALEAAPWMDFSASFSDPQAAKSGLTILCHQTTPHYPQPWILRKKNSMQNPVFPGRQAIDLSRTDPLILRYRLVIHKGDNQQWDCDKWQSRYNLEIHSER